MFAADIYRSDTDDDSSIVTCDTFTSTVLTEMNRVVKSVYILSSQDVPSVFISVVCHVQVPRGSVFFTTSSSEHNFHTVQLSS